MGLAPGIRLDGLSRPGRLFFEQVPVGKVGKLRPVIGQQIVFAIANVIANRFTNRGVDRWHGFSTETGEAIEFPGPAGGDCCQELTTGIGPAVFFGTGHVERPWRGHGKQGMLIAGQFNFPAGVVGQHRAEPVGKPLGDHGDGFPEVAS